MGKKMGQHKEGLKRKKKEGQPRPFSEPTRRVAFAEKGEI